MQRLTKNNHNVFDRPALPDTNKRNKIEFSQLLQFEFLYEYTIYCMP